jgi:penicillin-binding protein 2
MYNRRIVILVVVIAVMLAICLLRLGDMQLLSTSFYREQVAQLRVQKGSNQQVRTLRGRILDRNGKELATDEVKFWLAINYELSRFLDERVRQAMAIEVISKRPDANLAVIEQEFENRLNDLELLTAKCSQFGMSRADVLSRLQQINDKIWNLRTFLAWARNGPNVEILEKYDRNLNNVPLSAAIADFEKNYPDPRDRLRMTAKVNDIAEIKRVWPVVELKTDDDVFAARVEFLDVNGVEVLAKGERVYPYGSTAAQTIGWVGPPRQQDKELFADDRLASYLDDELCGREDGVEYVCEPILRGKRGELVYDIDRELIRRTEAQFGQDVRLTIDIELQQQIENHLLDCALNPNCKSPTAAVVLDVGTGEILALVSLPEFDLNLVRQNYGELVSDPCEPLRNRVINQQYPPGSVIKPVILTAGLESGEITAGQIISCPAHKAPQGWPSCWIYLRNNGVGHDTLWSNNARNAIKGSCNVYFSRLADRLDSLTLQNWLYRFGYGHKSSLGIRPSALDEGNTAGEGREPRAESRDLRQMQGQISNTPAKETITSFEQLPPLEPGEKRWFGIGHGNIRVTPMQVAEAMACIARDGIYKPPRLVADPCATETDATALEISPATLAVVYDGMYAVVEESGGTANKEFRPTLAYFSARGVKIYGKTGSTQQPEHAWFAGFAKDNNGKSIAIAIVVEGGQHGSEDAAPLARDILKFCIEAGYLGR